MLTAAALGAATLLAACGHGSPANTVRAGSAPIEPPTTVAAAVAAPTTTLAVAADDALATTTTLAPVTVSAGATVEVRFSTAPGWHATATLRREDGSTTEGIPVTADAPAVFADLPAGTYAPSIDAESDSSSSSGDTQLAPALQFVRGSAFTVADGDHVVVDCDGPGGCVVN